MKMKEIDNKAKKR